MDYLFLSSLVLAICLILLCLEINHHSRSASPLKLLSKGWEVTETPSGLKIDGVLEIKNPHQKMEVMVPNFEVKTTLLAKKTLQGVTTKSRIIPNHPDMDTRKDEYWTAYIVKSQQSTEVKVTIEILISKEQNNEIRTNLECIWVDFYWINYGPFGKLDLRKGLVVPLTGPTPLTSSEAYFQIGKGFQVLPLKTHILGVIDNPLDVLRTYTENITKPGDTLTIGETPLAIMQGRYRHPNVINPGLVAKILCKGFKPTSSLATACGLQALIDIAGPSRVISSWIIAASLKLIGVNGMFYRLAGTQARLIDDITGTTPPYDQYIVLGPRNAKSFCEEASKLLGINIAIVDVNDLGRVKVLASNRNCDQYLLKKALSSNPAGNANEQTPLVLVRPY